MKKKVLVCIEQTTLSYKYYVDIIMELNQHSEFEVEILNLFYNDAVNEHLGTLGNKVYTLFNKPYKKQLFHIARIIRQSNPDIIHAHETIPAFYAALSLLINFSLKKMIFHRHHSYYRTKAIHFMERIAFWRSNIAVAVSLTAQQQAFAEHPSAKNKIICIHNGIQLKDSGKPLPVAMELYKHKKKIVLIAWLVGRKGHEAAITAMDIIKDTIPEAVLFIAGTGPDWDKLQAEIAKKKLENHVVMLGEVKNIYALLKQVDISVLPSEAEAFNLSILETMAAERLSMASDIPSINECIKDGVTGVSIPVNNSGVLAEKLIYYLTNTAERERIAKNGYLVYQQQFTTAAMVKQFVCLYKTL